MEAQTRLSVPGVWFGKRWKGKQKCYPASVLSEIERDKKGARVFEVQFDEDDDFGGECLYEMRWDAVDQYRVDRQTVGDGSKQSGLEFGELQGLGSGSDVESPKPTPRSTRPRTPTRKKAEEIVDRADKQRQLKPSSGSGLKDPPKRRNRGVSDREPGPVSNEDEIRQALRLLGGKGLVGHLARGVQGKQDHGRGADGSESSDASEEESDRKDIYQEDREAPRLMQSMLRYHRTVYDWVLNGTDFKNPRKRHEALVLAQALDACRREGIGFGSEVVEILARRLVGLELADKMGDDEFIAALAWAPHQEVVPQSMLRTLMRDVERRKKLRPKWKKDSKGNWPKKSAKTQVTNGRPPGDARGAPGGKN